MQRRRRRVGVVVEVVVVGLDETTTAIDRELETSSITYDVSDLFHGGLLCILLLHAG